MRAALAALLLVVLVIPASAGEITVAAAADLSLALAPIVKNFQRETGESVRLSFGSSGDFFNQIENGAPYDAFLSADADYPAKLVALGFADGKSLRTYAVGQLVLWVPKNSRLDIQRQGMQALLEPSVHKIAIANPQHAPYGRAAVAALRHFGLYEKVKDRLVLGENVGQAAQFAESGNAQAGIIAMAHAVAPSVEPLGRYWVVPAGSYPPLRQAAVITSRSKNRTAAEKFLQYLAGPEAQAVFRRFGFLAPSEAH